MEAATAQPNVMRMTKHRASGMRLLTIAGFALAASAIACAAQERTPTPQAADASAREFVASFYAWYLRPRATNAGSATMDDALSEQSARFADTLLTAFRADRDAQAREPGNLVGLDFDAFTASQDPCQQYTAGSATEVGERIRVEVFAVCNGVRAANPSLVAVVEKQGTSWKFSNFIFTDGQDLLTLLAKLAADRKQPATDSSATA